jgi:hypothetical protein
MSAIRQVYELFQDRSKWTQVHFGVDAMGRDVHSSSPAAVCWCLVGALNKFGGSEAEKILLRKTARRLGYEYALTNLNDCNGYDAVMKILETALAEEQ